MATSQEIVTCDICKQEPLHLFCNGCEIRLCKKCVISHLESDSLEGHTIVLYKHRDARNIQPKVCLDHPSKVKSLYCKECFAEICVSCFAEHSEHEVTDLKQFVNLQFREITKCSENLCIRLPKCRQIYENLKLLLEETGRKYDQEHQNILDTGEDLHRKVNEKVEGLLDEINKQKKESLEMLQDMIKHVEAKLQEIDQTIDMCEATKISLDEVLKFTFDESSFDIAHNIEVTFSQFKTPRAFTVDVGLLRSIREERRLIDKPLEEDTPEKEIKMEGQCLVNVLFIENPRLKSIEDLLTNCRRYKEELRLVKELEEASAEYKILLQKAKRTGFRKTTPPYENFFDDDERRCQAPFLYDVISFVSKRYPNTRWKKAMSEFISLTSIHLGRKRQVFTADACKIFTTDWETTKPVED